jgi:hypothetical protein
MLQNVKKALANPEPSTHGTFETCQPALKLSAYRGRPEVIGSRAGRGKKKHGTLHNHPPRISALPFGFADASQAR